jgi:hypothetical protein
MHNARCVSSVILKSHNRRKQAISRFDRWSLSAIAIFRQRFVESIQPARSYRSARTSSPQKSRCDLQMLADVLDNEQLRCEPCTMKGKIRMTWRELNDQLRKARDAKVILQLYKAERKGKGRKRWLTRIYCRYSYLRRKKEMKAVASARSFV